MVGTPQSSDIVVLEEKDRRFSVSICKSSDERFLIIQSASSETAENYMLDLESADAKLLSVCHREFGIHYDIDHCMGFLYILTDKDGAKNSKLCRTPLASIPSQSTHWEDLWVPEDNAVTSAFAASWLPVKMVVINHGAVAGYEISIGRCALAGS
eukprot:Skav226316  [mRNA]  locus=scaffold3301:601007:601873:- [translate_table: standard]